MKVIQVTVFSLAYLALIYALPARPQDAEEFDFVPLEKQNGGPPVVIEGPLFSTPFDGLFDSFSAMVSRLRQQMDYILGRLPAGNGTLEGGFPILPDIDLSKGNTTSVTKVIDGHKVVINDTEYKQEGELGGSYFHVRVIDVLPDSSELTTEKNAEEVPTETKDTESVENSYENEIPKNREVYSNVETFDEVDSSLPSQKMAERSSSWDNIETFDSIEDNSIDYVYPPRDLSRDTYVNKLMADAGAPVNPDAEVFSNVETNNAPYMTVRRFPYFERISYPR